MAYRTWPYACTRWLGVAMCGVLAGCGAGANPAPAPPYSMSAGSSAVVSSPIAPEIAAAPTPRFALAPAVTTSTVAVADFQGGSIPPDKKTDFWGKALASFIIADLAASQNLRVVDREYLAEVLREQRLAATDLSDSFTRLRIGRILGAKYFIFGTYTIVGDQAALTARMDAVETGQIIESRSATGKESELRALSQHLAADFLHPLDQVVAEREAHSVPLSAGPPPKARNFFDQGLAYERQGDYQKAIDFYTQALSLYPHYVEARQHLEEASEASARQ